MKKLNETPIGNIQPATFRPTEAEKLILLNISDMIDQGRTVTQQDAINVPEEELKQEEIGDDNLESAYEQLVKLKMIQVNPDQTISITPAGQPVVDEAKKAKEQEAMTQQSDSGQGEQPQGNPMAGPPPGMNPTAAGNPMESFILIKYLNDLSKLNG